MQAVTVSIKIILLLMVYVGLGVTTNFAYVIMIIVYSSMVHLITWYRVININFSYGRGYSGHTDNNDGVM